MSGSEDDKNPRFPGNFGGGGGGSRPISPTGGKRKAVMVTLDPEAQAWLDKQGKRQRSQLINEAVAQLRAAHEAVEQARGSPEPPPAQPLESSSEE